MRQLLFYIFFFTLTSLDAQALDGLRFFTQDVSAALCMKNRLTQKPPLPLTVENIRPHEFSIYPEQKKELMVTLAEQLRASDGRIHFGQLAPDAPARSFYHYGYGGLIHDEIVHNGFSEAQYKAILNTKSGTGDWSGFFLSANPTSSAMYGDAMMEVELYKDYFPYRDPATGRILWHKVSDVLTQDDDVNIGSQMKIAIDVNHDQYTSHHVLQDLRAIKSLRWPDKDFIKDLWFHLKSESLSGNEEKDLLTPASQWLFTPNYTNEERWKIIEQDRPRFISFMNSQAAPEVHRNGGPAYYDKNALLLNNIFKALFHSSTDFFDFDGPTWNFTTLRSSIISATPKQFAEFKWFATQLSPQSEVRTILGQVASIREPFAGYDAQKSKQLVSDWNSQIEQTELTRTSWLKELPNAPEQKGGRRPRKTKSDIQKIVQDLDFQIQSLRKQNSKFQALILK